MTTKHLIERTVVIVKHDGIQRGLVGEIIKRFEQRGMKISALKMIRPTEEHVNKHYVMTDAWVEKLGENTRRAAKAKGVELKESNKEIAERVREWNKKYLMEGPIVVVLFEGYHAIEVGRKIVGPAEARQAPVGTIRGDFSADSYEIADVLKRPVRNLVHASGNREEAENEIKVWFSEMEIYDYDQKAWEIIH
ncbi:TPA: nucleoside-diphosphate kinase [Candidatus Woesearchaeota archaeon]|nr:nucleoside-diphosphate kinase [Candidatus Woesearchaeota archaeon]